MSLKESILLEHLSLWRRTDFVWGYADCFMSVFSYCKAFPHVLVDIGAEWRGTYDDEKGALRVLAAAGGGLAGMTKAMGEAGIPATGNPERGDPVCVRIDEHEIGGLYLGDMTALRMAGRGQLDARIKHVRAWRI